MKPIPLTLRSLGLLTCFLSLAAALCAQQLKVVHFRVPDSAEMTDGRTTSTVHIGARFGNWTLMAIANEPLSPDHFVVLEDFTTQTGHLAIVDTRGTRFDLPKTNPPGPIPPGSSTATR